MNKAPDTRAKSVQNKYIFKKHEKVTRTVRKAVLAFWLSGFLAFKKNKNEQGEKNSNL